MARDFDGTADYLQSGSPATALPLTLACWLRSDQSAASQAVMSVGTTGAVNRVQLSFAGAAAGDPIQVSSVTTAGAVATASSGSSPGANTWMHGAAVITNTASRRAFVNGVGGTVETTSRDPSAASFDYAMVGARIATTVGGYFNGQVAEAAVYGAALTTEEIEMLAAGYSPLMVRPQSLVLYAPLFGRNGAAGGEEEWVGGRTLTQTSSPALYDHPRIIYPRRSIWVPKASAGGGGAATVTPTIIASTASFGSATVARTAVAAVTTARIASTASIGAHTVARTGVAAVTPSRIASTVSFGTATVTRTAVAAVSPTRIASTASIGAHVVTMAGMGAVSAPRIESTVSFGAATVTRSAVHSIQPGRIDSSVTFGVPVVTSSTPQIFVGRIASTAAVYAPPVVRTGPVVAASEYRRFSSAFATSRTLASAITQTVTLASAIDLE